MILLSRRQFSPELPSAVEQTYRYPYAGSTPRAARRRHDAAGRLPGWRGSSASAAAPFSVTSVSARSRPCGRNDHERHGEFLGRRRDRARALARARRAPVADRDVCLSVMSQFWLMTSHPQSERANR